MCLYWGLFVLVTQGRIGMIFWKRVVGCFDKMACLFMFA